MPPVSEFTPRLLAFVALGGLLGALARYALTSALPRSSLVWGTVAVNVLGCFLAGWLLFGPLSGAAPASDARVLALAGFLGAFTTMSAFAVEAVAYAAAGAWGPAALVVVLNPVASVAGAALGRWVALTTG